MGMQASLAALEANSHAACLAHAKQEQSDKSTVGTYKRHVDRYEKWWIHYQAEQSASIEGWISIPAFPITATKVSMLLGHESTQEKKFSRTLFVYVGLQDAAMLLFSTTTATPMDDVHVGKQVPGYGSYGYREWYDYHLFMGKEDIKNKMSYDNHHKQITIMHRENNIEITKATHAGRSYATINSHAHGATVGGTKALGGWNESGSFRNCYDRAFPIDALLGAASFNAHRLEEYYLPQDDLSNATAVVTAAEETAQLAFHNLLDHMAQSMRGYAIADEAGTEPQ
ncbi:hypothetical protein PILCRDRAFT_86658 [Piloderma croceum F 1598]|uniref:Uncharacterized protein n=1 Tax=Piloderma croceum (strain F 1598) TaxID=765440 RepID=A0A0C3BHY6_PILCF|nr:hypothetical protein PILCRDRAFT_86658 [Piloderma croceum F 1598]